MSEQTNLDVGLEVITVQTQPDTAPRQVSLHAVAPANPQFELQLEEVLYIPASLEERLVNTLRPRIAHRDLQQPHIFYAMVDPVLRRLRARSRSTRAPKERNTLRGAIDTLEKSKTLMGMLRRLQHALHRA